MGKPNGKPWMKYGMNLPEGGTMPDQAAVPMHLYAGKLDYVIDIGAHAGVLGLFAAHKGAKRVVMIEASPRVFKDLLVINVEKSPYKDVCELHNKAVWNKTGEKLFITNAWGVSTITGDMSTDNTDKKLHETESISFLDVLNLYDDYIDYLKIDVEGSEWCFFDKTEEIVKILTTRVGIVDLELHDSQGFRTKNMSPDWPAPHRKSHLDIPYVQETLIPTVVKWLTKEVGFKEVTRCNGKYSNIYETRVGDWKRRIFRKKEGLKGLVRSQHEFRKAV
jgi:FkbM family methyltransferase